MLRSTCGGMNEVTKSLVAFRDLHSFIYEGQVKEKKLIYKRRTHFHYVVE